MAEVIRLAELCTDSSKSQASVQKAVRRHGVKKAVKLASSYGAGLCEGLGSTRQEAKDSRNERILQNFGSIDASRVKAGGKRGFSLTNLGIALIETTSAFVDYNHVRNFPHQVEEQDGEWFYSPGIQAKQ